jgi:hypothetical protein
MAAEIAERLIEMSPKSLHKTGEGRVDPHFDM